MCVFSWDISVLSLVWSIYDVPVGYIPGRSHFKNRHLRMPRALRSCRAVAVLFRSVLNINWSSPWGKIVDQSATHNGCFPLCMRELCVAIVTRWYTGQPDTRLPSPPASWVTCPKFHPLLQRSSAVYWFGPNLKGSGDCSFTRCSLAA